MTSVLHTIEQSASDTRTRIVRNFACNPMIPRH